MLNSDHGLVKIYNHKLRAHALKVQNGEKDEVTIESLVSEALEHFCKVETGYDDNVSQLKSKLTQAIEFGKSDQPIFSECLTKARELLSKAG